MREIKFRGWERYLEIMTYDNELCGHLEYFYNPVKAVNIVLNENDDGYDYMQYTGRNDKNNKEIYEDDIVEYLDNETDCIVTGEVEFDFGQWSVRCTETGMSSNLYDISQKAIEVIGNIYEGELLNEIE